MRKDKNYDGVGRDWIQGKRREDTWVVTLDLLDAKKVIEVDNISEKVRHVNENERTEGEIDLVFEVRNKSGTKDFITKVRFDINGGNVEGISNTDFTFLNVGISFCY